MGRYLDLTRAIRYEINEFNEVNILDDKKLPSRNVQVTNLIPSLEQGTEEAGIKFVTPPDVAQRKTPSQRFNSLNSLISYPKAFPDLSPIQHRILERASQRECCFLIDFLTNSSFEHLTATQQAVEELLTLGLLERTQNGRGRTSLYSLSQYEFNERNELKLSDDKNPALTEREVYEIKEIN